MKKNYLLIVLICLPGSWASAQLHDTPRPTPLTRPVLKKMIEDVKQRTPRIPLPDLTEADRNQLGDQADNYETRLRYHYLNGIEPSRPIVPSASLQSVDRNLSGNAPRSREQDSKYSLENGFKVELFWIVSRINNCQYCLGHQESKLLGAGRSEDQIAGLDGDWSEFEPHQRAAFAFARKFTLEPFAFTDDDILRLRTHFTDLQILEMILSMSGNNSINRWKEGVGVPQRQDEGGYSRMATRQGEPADPKLPRGTYLTPTSKKYETHVTSIIDLTGTQRLDSTCATVAKRPKLESMETVTKKLIECRTRTARLPLLADEIVRTTLPAVANSSGDIPNWIKLLAYFPTAGASRLDTYTAAESGGDLSPLLKSQLAWIVARQDQAWYALGQSMSRLKAAGQTDSDIVKLDGDWSTFSVREQALFTIAKNLGMSPVILTDREVANAIAHAGPRDTVQTISYVNSRASFNRLTESVGLPLESQSAKNR